MRALRVRPSRTRALGLVSGFTADALIGDPVRWHPTAGFGQIAAAAERRVWADSRARGSAYAVGLVGGAAALGTAMTRLTRGRSWAAIGATGAAAWAVLGARSFAAEAKAMRDLLGGGDIAGARLRLPHLCGRDSRHLDTRGLVRATIESVAENTSDAVVAPLLWGAAFGVPGLLAYRAINTLDAMVGHHTPRYDRFGWASARLDDLANWLPARLTALLTVLAAPSVGGSVRRAGRVLMRDGGRHPSPNAGRCEAAAAGALGVRLGGTNVYGGQIEHRPVLGDGHPPTPGDIGRAIRISRIASAASAAVAVAVLWSRKAVR